MKKQYVLPLLTIAAITGLALTRLSTFELTQRKFVAGHKNGSGAPAGSTGAPGESSCTSCHSGSTLNGDAINQLTLKDGSGNTVTSYLPDSTYTVHFFIDNAAVKKGFQLVALNESNNQQAGTMTATPATSVLTLGGKKYVTHKTSSNTTITGWDFKWKAPSTNVGAVRFYAASNVTNNNGQQSGDQIYLSQHSVASNPLASMEEVGKAISFSAFFASSNNTLNLKFDSKLNGKGFVNLVDLSGKSVYNYHFGDVKIGTNSEKVLLPAEIQNGIYIVHLFVNNQSTTYKIQIQK